MEINDRNIDFYVPDGESAETAFGRTTCLCVAAHQDDIEFMAYCGILDCFHDQRKWFSGITVTDGAGSPRNGCYAGCSDESMKAIRKIEQRKAAVLGEYGFQAQLGYTSAEVKSGNAAVAEIIGTLIGQAKPEIVFSHNPFDKHDTHVAVFFQALRALRSLPKASRPRKFYGCECWRGLDWVNDDKKVLFDISARPSLGPALSGVFDSQIAGGKRYDLAATGRRQANATYLASHACDRAEMMQYAVDMTPLIEDDSLSALDYAKEYLRGFQQDVENRITVFDWRK